MAKETIYLCPKHGHICTIPSVCPKCSEQLILVEFEGDCKTLKNDHCEMNGRNNRSLNNTPLNSTFCHCCVAVLISCDHLQCKVDALGVKYLGCTLHQHTTPNLDHCFTKCTNRTG
jgi:hypothetical protein